MLFSRKNFPLLPFVMLLSVTLLANTALAGKRNKRVELPEAEVTRFQASNGKEFACHDGSVVSVLRKAAKQEDHILTKAIKKKKFLKKTKDKLKAAKASGDKKALKKARRKFKNRKSLYQEIVGICSPSDTPGGGGDDTTGADALEALDRALTASDVRHLAEVAGYGIKAGDTTFSSIMNQGVGAVVDSFMLVRDEAGDFEEVRENWLDGNLGEQLNTTKVGLNIASTYAAINTNNGFHHKLFQFLLELVTIADDTFDESEFDMAMMKSYHALLLDAAKSSDLDYIELYRSMNKHPAMLDYLDGDVNLGCDSPNENLAREDMELFATGTHKICEPGVVDPTPIYTEDDVVEAAKALTGWRIARGIDPDNGAESPANHCDEGPFTLFAGTPDQVQVEDLDEFIDQAIFGVKREDTALFLAKQIALFYLNDDPDCDLLNALADEILDQNFKLKPVLRKVLMSKAFYGGRETIGKGVFDYVVTSIRNSGVPYPANVADAVVRDSATRIHQAPTVFNYFPSDLLNDARQMSKINFAQDLCRDLYEDWDPADSILAEGNPTAVQAVDHVAALFNVPLNVDQRLQLINALNTTSSDQEDPFDSTNPNHIQRLLAQVCAPIAASPAAQLR